MLVGKKSVSNSAGVHHMHMRKVVNPAFTPKVSQQYVPRILEIAEELCAEWAEAKYTKGEDCMKAYTFQVTCPTFLCAYLMQCFDSCTLTANLILQHCFWLSGQLAEAPYLSMSTAQVDAIQTTAMQCRGQSVRAGGQVVSLLYHLCQLLMCIATSSRLHYFHSIQQAFAHQTWSLRARLHSGNTQACLYACMNMVVYNMTSPRVWLLI